MIRVDKVIKKTFTKDLISLNLLNSNFDFTNSENEKERERELMTY